VFDWAEYLVLAESLARRTDDESALRSAVSRAYYAASNRACDLLVSEGQGLPGRVAESHLQTWLRFRGRGRARNSIFVNGDRLRRRRHHADYRRTPPVVERDAVDAIGRAKYILDKLRAIENARRRGT
jgi:uncharacterized protein (UPF0332 family)